MAFSYSRSNSSVPKEAGRQLIKSHTHTHIHKSAPFTLVIAFELMTLLSAKQMENDGREKHKQQMRRRN